MSQTAAAANRGFGQTLFTAPLTDGPGGPWIPCGPGGPLGPFEKKIIRKLSITSPHKLDDNWLFQWSVSNRNKREHDDANAVLHSSHMQFTQTTQRFKLNSIQAVALPDTFLCFCLEWLK